MVTDLTNLDLEQTLSYLQKIVDGGQCVLHGSNSDSPYKILEPRQANDGKKVSGNKIAVYATIEPDLAVMNAIVNKRYLRSKFDSIAFGYDLIDGQRVWEVTPNIYKLMQNHDPKVTSNGYIYILNRKNFTGSPEAETEFHALETQIPVGVCKVSGKIGNELFVNVVKYSKKL